jgi:hypothetical protein
MGKRLGKGGKNGKRFALKVGCNFEILIPLWKTRFAFKVIILFEKTLEFKQAIIICYGKQNIVTSHKRILKAQVWAIANVVTSYLSLVVVVCVMNQSHGHWLLLMFNYWRYLNCQVVSWNG